MKLVLQTNMETATERTRSNGVAQHLRLRVLNAAFIVLTATAAVTGWVFWRLELVRARLQTGIANDEAKSIWEVRLPKWEASLPTKGAERNAPTGNPRSKEDGR